LDGLSLFVRAKGTKYWYFRFSWDGKQQRISLGRYPEIGLRDARTRRDEARSLLAKGIDPRARRLRERTVAQVAGATTFEAAFHLWRDFKALSLKTGRQSTLSQIDRIFAKDILPTLWFISSPPETLSSLALPLTIWETTIRYLPAISSEPSLTGSLVLILWRDGRSGESGFHGEVARQL
jgi:Arm DNA-binding domain